MTRRRSLAFAALSAQRIAGANSRPRIGMIGVGNIGRRHEVAAISDAYSKRKQEAAAFCGLAAKDVHHDYQELVSRPGLDAIFVCTPAHWHFDMAMAPLRAGVQVGSQYASEDRAHEAREVIAQYKVSGRPWHNNQYYNGEFMRMLREPSRNPHDRPNPKAS